ncbi:hypothetical protein [Metabacillus fastidiosus]|uniref:hypothetical protein n=1 Tax=Metabacillus fastidiosus TaxID=1458 RepID=UPI002E1EDBAA|nr:hypothetical protein [Metabacillus fastidiosus]
MMNLLDLVKDEAFILEDIYIPFVGKCKVNDFIRSEDYSEVAVSIKPYRTQRKEEDASYILTFDLPIEINLIENKVQGYYIKNWIGGLVEKVEINLTIDLITRNFSEEKFRKDNFDSLGEYKFVSFNLI